MISTTAPPLYILSEENLAPSDRSLQKLAAMLGLECRQVTAPEITQSHNSNPGLQRHNFACAVSFAVLQRHWRNQEFAHCLRSASYLLVYGFKDTRQDDPALRWLTKSQISSVQSSPGGWKKFAFHEEGLPCRWSVSGLSFHEKVGLTHFFAGEESNLTVTPAISVDGNPYLIQLSQERGTCFLLAEEVLVDIDLALPVRATSLREWYAQLIAVVIFLRTAFGKWCWSAPVIGANFILDDLSLKQRHGFVSYQRLLQEISRLGCALTLGFIPYNFWRSHQATARLVRQMPDYISLAVHGCDHTDCEFANVDEQWLNATVGCSLERMETHETTTGLSFDRVFIFPQGRFSRQAVRAVQQNGFQAIVNSMPWPVNGQHSPLTINDLLQVAVTRYEHFPIFVRRYSNELFDLAFDVLLQKPVLAAAYHDYFREGYESLSSFVRYTQELTSSLTWMPLGKVTATSCLLRQVDKGLYALRHFSDRLEFCNPEPQEITLFVEKPHGDHPIDAVRCGADDLPFVVEQGFLRYTVKLAAAARLTVTISHPAVARQRRAFSVVHEIVCFLRRSLSDFRDNYLARSKRVLALFRRLKRSAEKVGRGYS